MEQLIGFLPVGVVIVLMYFMIFRPQQKQRKDKEILLEGLKKGDRVMTIGGIYGIIRAIREDRVTLEVASGIYVQFAKSAISSLIRKEERESRIPEPEFVDDDGAANFYDENDELQELAENSQDSGD